MTPNIQAEFNKINGGERNPRPHKILMLLSVLELYKTGKLRENKIFYTDDLVSIFSRYYQEYWHCSKVSGNEVLI